VSLIKQAGWPNGKALDYDSARINPIIPSCSYQEIAGSIPASVTVSFYRSGNITMLSVILLAIFQWVLGFFGIFPSPAALVQALPETSSAAGSSVLAGCCWAGWAAVLVDWWCFIHFRKDLVRFLGWRWPQSFDRRRLDGIITMGI
jgi:hypothetical protein